jgi:hypothetical protein
MNTTVSAGIAPAHTTLLSLAELLRAASLLASAELPEDGTRLLQPPS